MTGREQRSNGEGSLWCVEFGRAAGVGLARRLEKRRELVSTEFPVLTKTELLLAVCVSSHYRPRLKILESGLRRHK